MATLSMSATAAIGAPCNRRSGLAASCTPRSITSRWRHEPRPGRSRRQRRRGTARRRDQRERHRAAHSDPRGPAFAPAFSGQAATNQRPPRRYTLIPPDRAGFLLPGRPWGQMGTLAPRAGCGRRGCLRLQPEHGDGAGWAGARTPAGEPAAASTSRTGWSARRATLRTRSAPQRGVWGRSPMIRSNAWQPGRGGAAARRRGCPTQPESRAAPR